MLNLSDKELDRLSKEAAQEYEPGEVLGPNAWERLEIRLDSDLGRYGPNPLRQIRRFPFYYAPALLLVLIGISYFLVKRGNRAVTASESPPSAIVKIPDAKKSSSSNPTHNEKSTPAASSSTTPSLTDATDPHPAGVASPNQGSASGARIHAVPNSDAAGGAGSGSAAAVRAGSGSDAVVRGGSGVAGVVRGGSATLGAANSNHSRRQDNHSAIPGGQRPFQLAAAGAAAGSNTPGNPAIPAERELQFSAIQGLSQTKEAANINDSALRAFTKHSTIPGPIRRNALVIKRNLQFGVLVAPDFASVNSLAGGKPGSTMGITLDWQFASRWYLSSGLLLDRRNYAARSQDFHASPSFYSNYGITPRYLDFVKGSLQMLEIPLNLRYDFSVTGNTLFFASAGMSSYLLATENGNCYVNSYGQELAKNFQHPNPSNYLFSSMNLSLGVETGISNSLSVLIAPYMKMPVGTIGLGQMQMSSVGINFSLKWAPVISSRRR
jgi:hypothetical protein